MVTDLVQSEVDCATTWSRILNFLVTWRSYILQLPDDPTNRGCANRGVVQGAGGDEGVGLSLHVGCWKVKLTVPPLGVGTPAKFLIIALMATCLRQGRREGEILPELPIGASSFRRGGEVVGLGEEMALSDLIEQCEKDSSRE